jgi:hypothetical protein
LRVPRVETLGLESCSPAGKALGSYIEANPGLNVETVEKSALPGSAWQETLKSEISCAYPSDKFYA